MWLPATRAVGLDGLRFHDLRHTGNTLAAATGASTRELMARMGHASARAALIYQHATRDRDAAIAAALSGVIASRTSAGSLPVGRWRIGLGVHDMPGAATQDRGPTPDAPAL